MKAFKIVLIMLGLFALALAPVSTTGQSPVGDRIFYPPEFSPLNTTRPRKSQRSLIPPTKFVKAPNAIGNRYIVVLNDDVVSSEAPLEVRRAVITAIANRHAQAHHGKVGYVYETAIKGYSIELASEAEAIALSEDAQVRWVEEDGWGQFANAQADQNKPQRQQCSTCHE